MSEQYFANNPTSQHRETKCAYLFKTHPMLFTTDSGVFSRGEVDSGTDILLKSLPEIEGKILDIGCGYGVVGICIKKEYPKTEVFMTDVNERAVMLAKRNALENNVEVNVVCGDGITSLTEKEFDTALINPPIRAGKKTIYRLFDEIKSVLNNDGVLYCVIRKKQGADSAKKYLKTLFNNIEVIERSKGYHVFKIY